MGWAPCSLERSLNGMLVPCVGHGPQGVLLLPVLCLSAPPSHLVGVPSSCSWGWKIFAVGLEVILIDTCSVRAVVWVWRGRSSASSSSDALAIPPTHSDFKEFLLEPLLCARRCP